MLSRAGLAHNVLNAKEHAREADIVAQAGKTGMITVATNMAGRGTDIVLGGNVKHLSHIIRNNPDLSEEEKAARIKELEDGWQEEHDRVIAAGGLHIVGTERHESRRIDNQLRGRSGRQGDIGSSRFYLSFEDPLLRLFALDRHAALLDTLAPERGVPIEANLLTRQIESAQRKVEGRNFDMRKQVLEYDDVANDQRKVIYSRRNEVLETEDNSAMMTEMRQEAIENLVDLYMPADSIEEQWDLVALEKQLFADFHIHAPVTEWFKQDPTLDNQDVKERVWKLAQDDYAAKTEMVGAELMRQFERNIFLQVMDSQWREHLSAMDYLRQGIHLRGYAQKNPKQEYKMESFEMFQNLWQNIRNETARLLSQVRFELNEPVAEESAPAQMAYQENHAPAPDITYLAANGNAAEAADFAEDDFSPEALAARGQMVHRNDPCPCGSGLRYKQCHGKLS